MNGVTVQTAPGNVFHFGKKKKKGGDGAIVSYKLRELVKTADCDWQTGANKKQSDRGISEDINKTKKILKTDLITKKKNEKKKTKHKKYKPVRFRAMYGTLLLAFILSSHSKWENIYLG